MKNKIKRYSLLSVLVFLSLFGFGVSAQADILFLKNGRQIEGIIKKETDQDISLDIGSGVMKFSKEQIASINRSYAEKDQVIRGRWLQEKTADQARAKEIQDRLEREPKPAVLDQKNGKMTLEATLNQKVKANLVLDTGASLVALSSKIAASLGLDIPLEPGKDSQVVELVLADGRKVKARKIILENVSVQGSEVKNVEAAVLPEQDDSAFDHDGLLGMSFLKNFTFKVDQKNNKLILEKL